MLFAYKNLLGRTETRTRDRMYCQTIRTVRDINRDDRARIATCSLRTPPDRLTGRLKENYSIDLQRKQQDDNIMRYTCRQHDNISMELVEERVKRRLRRCYRN